MEQAQFEECNTALATISQIHECCDIFATDETGLKAHPTVAAKVRYYALELCQIDFPVSNIARPYNFNSLAWPR